MNDLGEAHAMVSILGRAVKEHRVCPLNIRNNPLLFVLAE